jgi:hypothetical protein
MAPMTRVTMDDGHMPTFHDRCLDLVSPISPLTSVSARLSYRLRGWGLRSLCKTGRILPRVEEAKQRHRSGDTQTTQLQMCRWYAMMRHRGKA